MLTVSPVSYNGGAVWSVMTGIHGALQAIAYGLLVLFFAAGVVKTCGSFAEVRRPEQALKLFVRFALAKAAVDYGLDLMLAVFDIVQGMIAQVIGASGASGIGTTTLPQELIDTINACGFWESIPLWAVTLIGSPAHHGAVLCHGADRLWAYVFPLDVRRHRADPAVGLCGRTHQQRGQKLPAQLCGWCAYRAWSSRWPASSFLPLPPARRPLTPMPAPLRRCGPYVGSLAFNLLVLVGAVKGCDRIVKEIMGL